MMRLSTCTGANTTSVAKFQSTSVRSQHNTATITLTREIRMTFWTIQADPEFRQFGVL